MTKFKYKLDRRTKITTLVAIGVISAGLGLLWWLSPTSYLPAWFSSVVVAFLLLGTLSIPRSIRLTDEGIEIRCVVEITQIPYRHIHEIRTAQLSEFNLFIPLLGSPGVMGYFGYWLACSDWSMIKVYASKRNDLVVIEDIYEQKFLVSCDRAQELIDKVRGQMK